MKTIGIIGGMSAQSTRLYYERLNSETQRRLGGLHAAELIIWSVDFAEIAELQRVGQWDEAGRRLADVASRLEGAGAEMILLATNTMHKVAGSIEAAISVPFLHIADATGAAIRAAGCRRPALIATAFTMEQDFYIGRLQASFGLDVLVPEADERAAVHAAIYDELCKGAIREETRAYFVDLAARLIARGADSVILGCTEVGLLLNTGNVAAPVFDTTLIHADQALDLALSPAHRAAAE